MFFLQSDSSRWNPSTLCGKIDSSGPTARAAYGLADRIDEDSGENFGLGAAYCEVRVCKW